MLGMRNQNISRLACSSLLDMLDAREDPNYSLEHLHSCYGRLKLLLFFNTSFSQFAL